jgi:hypothetical protein
MVIASFGSDSFGQNRPDAALALAPWSRVSAAKSRAISPENPTGEKGKGGMATDGPGKNAARDLGPGWKISPLVVIPAGKTITLGDIDGAGAIKHIWMTPTGNWRLSILRMYWDGETSPSVETPVGDFFCSGWGTFAPLSSMAVCVNPGSGMNCYWEMPFRKHARITMENLSAAPMRLYYQVDYEVGAVPQDAAYFHAQFRRVDPVPYGKVYTILDGVRGHGQYVGTYMAWGSHSSGWWGEGEMKFYLDGDKEYPTICGTGVEDYFCGSYGFVNKTTKQYQEFTTPYAGLNQVVRPDGVYASQQRFGMYRWHLPDPIRFETDLRVTVQALGWHSDGRYLPLQDDIATVAFWYQTEPHTPFPALPDTDHLDTQGRP